MHSSDVFSSRLIQLLSFFLLLLVALSGSAQIVPTNDPPVYGPYNAAIMAGRRRCPQQDGGEGHGAARRVTVDDVRWVWVDATVTGSQLVAGYGDVAGEYSRYIGLEPGKLLMWAGPENSFSAPATVTPGKWQFVAATFDGQSVFRLYSDGAQVGQGVLALGRVAPVVQIAPPVPTAAPGMPSFQGQHFGGKVAGFTIVREALTRGDRSSSWRGIRRTLRWWSLRKARSRGRCRRADRRAIELRRIRRRIRRVARRIRRRWRSRCRRGRRCGEQGDNQWSWRADGRWPRLRR